MTLPPSSTRVHGTCVSRGPFAALLRGPSGSGKSDLALRFLTTTCAIPRHNSDTRHQLIADDQSVITASIDGLTVTAPPTIAGRLEVRGIGIITTDARPSATLALIVDLSPPNIIERLPDARTETLLGHAIPLIQLAPFEASTPIKLALAIDMAASRLIRAT